ncbi:hypothetical protein F5Y16DRAFT_422783 [Xylariaceae sp. FL0255]|nr:hypothetical protein F5Y16DRAFT_422783 [Xylariaceae sp. FL0255]
MDESISTYRKYKADTKVFTTWLGKTARAAGWEPPTKFTQHLNHGSFSTAANDGPRLKGKARKLAKDAKKVEEPPLIYTVTTNDLVNQIDLATRKCIKMPDTVRYALQFAIEARERCAAWFEKTLTKTEDEIDGHRHFIGILRQALDQLSSIVDSIQNKKSKTKEKAPKKADSTSIEDDYDQFLLDTFKKLQVDNYPSDDGPTRASRPTQTTEPQDTQDSPSFELEVDQELEASFKIFCFFEDNYLLRRHLKKIWRGRHNKSCSLVQAFLITVATIVMVSEAEEDAYSAYSTIHPPSPNKYRDLAGFIFEADALAKGAKSEFLPEPIKVIKMKIHDEDFFVPMCKTYIPDDENPELPTETKILEITPFDEFVLLPMGRTLLRLAQLQPISELFCWPAAPSIRLQYLARPELLEDSRVKRALKHETFICQLFMDMALGDRLSDLNKIPKLEDPFYSVMRQLWHSGTVSTTMVFASQVLSDIHEILGDNHSPLEALKSKSEALQKSFQFCPLNCNKHHIHTKGVAWSNKENDVILEVHGMAEYYMKGPPLSYAKAKISAKAQRPMTIMIHNRKRLAAEYAAKLKESTEKVGNTLIHANKDPDFFYRANPLHAGWILLDLSAKMEEVGVAIANHYLSAFAVAHLYNAIDGLKIVDLSWPEMERVIKAQANAIFANDIPNTPKQILARFRYRAGVILDRSIKHCVLQFNPDMAKSREFHHTYATKAIRASCLGKETVSHWMNDIRNQVEFNGNHVYGQKGGRKNEEEQTKSQPHLDPLRRAFQTDKIKHARKLSPCQALAKIDNYANTVLPEMEIDYIGLTRISNNIFERLLKRLSPEVSILYPQPEDPFNTGINHPGILLCVHDILCELDRVTNKCRNSAAVARKQAKLLIITAEVIRDVLNGN